jgi:uncharacterized membrane protein
MPEKKPENKNDHFVWAVFDNFEQAEEAARQVVKWDKSLDDIHLGAVGVVHQMDNGKIKTNNYGARNTRKGAKVGMLAGVLAAMLPAVTLVGGLATGAVMGGAAGSLSKKKLGLTDEDMTRAKKDLEDGKAILIVACDDFEMKPTDTELTELGGEVQRHTISSQALKESADQLSVT